MKPFILITLGFAGTCALTFAGCKSGSETFADTTTPALETSSEALADQFDTGVDTMFDDASDSVLSEKVEDIQDNAENRAADVKVELPDSTDPNAAPGDNDTPASVP